MDEHQFRKALAELQSFRQHLPDCDIEEPDVLDYHRLLESLEKETGLNLHNFFIPDERLERAITGTSAPSRDNRFQGETEYASSRSCDRNLFLRKLDAAIIYISGLLPTKNKDQIGF
ncbi:MAG TPA: hypothetical protein VN956_00645 [Pyrinomonadaceae bacterium]|nr:hypothetical protein [Pyrinomonadaceae bacterium]